jgi:hypothetical protein
MPVVGVIGHRKIGEPGRVMAGIDQALDRIQARFAGRPIVLMASLSEGTDRLVVRRALECLHVSTFVVPLPFVRQEFEADFRTPESLEEFRWLVARAQYVLQLPPPHGTPHGEAYGFASRFILDRANVLLAVWDGAPGGPEDATGDLVPLARHCGIPVAWVHASTQADTDVSGPIVRAPGSTTFDGW